MAREHRITHHTSVTSLCDASRHRALAVGVGIVCLLALLGAGPVLGSEGVAAFGSAVEERGADGGARGSGSTLRNLMTLDFLRCLWPRSDVAVESAIAVEGGDLDGDPVDPGGGTDEPEKDRDG
jgi:hypothetical protein